MAETAPEVVNLLERVTWHAAIDSSGRTSANTVQLAGQTTHGPHSRPVFVGTEEAR